MALSIPNRKKPGENSFPTEPSGVQEWLTSLLPATSMESVRALYRGLKHSNRLYTSNSHRIEIAELFAPVVIDSTQWLQEEFADQSLPLPKHSRRCFQLLTELLRELAFTYKIIVSDSYDSLLPGPSRDRASAIHKALVTITQLLECHLNVHMDPPVQLLRDANLLYRYALKSKLTDVSFNRSSSSIEQESTIEQVYIFVQLLSLATPFTIRQRQIPLLCRFLLKQSQNLAIQFSPEDVANSEHAFAIHLEQDCRPQLLQYSLATPSDNLLLLDIKPLVNNLENAISRSTDTNSALYEAETLSRTSLVELREALTRKRSRKTARAIVRKQTHTKTGIKEITASLHYNPLNIPSNTESPNPDLEKMDFWPRRVVNQDRAWTVINENRMGACLEWRDAGTSECEVGEVVALRKVNAGANEPWIIGFVRWIKLVEIDRIQLGIKYFAKHAEPVAAINADEEDPEIYRDCLLARFRTNDQELESLIAPPAAFHESEHILTGENSTHQLSQKIASTPMCDVFLLEKISENEEVTA